MKKYYKVESYPANINDNCVEVMIVAVYKIQNLVHLDKVTVINVDDYCEVPTINIEMSETIDAMDVFNTFEEAKKEAEKRLERMIF
jgi:hypothetical protein